MVIRISTVCPFTTSFGIGITLTSKGKSFCISSSSSLLQDTKETEAVKIAIITYIGNNPILNLLNIAIIVLRFKS
ncbi:conserved hypothetical protein [Sphingobacterium multivorum]|uniref:Uncharacterized protein n=1 Tax=Sphingobacterium multivorum TaxID=28454 RepID=A0A653ZNP1_SPHMU|nr:conserved hypothetical protein [Sphingobacterium multivorum]